jgi:eukaryotic-like serine/threonine-protein kinase
MLEIGKYKILDRVGEGAMGVVYRAHDPVLNRAVAIKVMADSVARDDLLRGRFLREAQAAGSLQHPNVVTIYDFGEVDGHLFIAMEFVEGEDLEQLLGSDRPLTTLQKVDIIIDVLGGLAYAHKRGIVHRDIKPPNIRIDADGRARIMDFGIAHVASTKVTRTGTTVGTPAYMAPEQIAGGDIVPASDLFSVGAVMFELLTGRKAFDDASLHRVFYNIVTEPAPHLTEFAPGLPPALDDIVQKALEKEPENRYTTAIDMANALTAVRRELDSIARKSGSVSLRSQIDAGLATRPTVQIAPKKTPSRGMTYGAVGGVAVVGVAVALMFIKPSRPPTAPDTASPAPATSAAQSTAVTPPPSVTVSAPVASAGSAAGAAPPAIKTVPLGETARPDARVSPRDLEAFRALQVTALDARRRAADAGASADQLQAGDDQNDRATALALEGKTADAAARLNAATRAWLTAESDARAKAAAAANATKQRAAEPERPPPVSTPPVTQTAPVITPTVPAVVAPAPSNPAAEIAAVVDAYARAVESRDIAPIRRAFPGISAAQASGFEQFFSTIRSLRATMTLGALDMQASSAEGRVTGQYDYVTTAGKSERQPLDFQATFRKDGSLWKLVAVRANR